jgi:hypothetical protein
VWFLRECRNTRVIVFGPGNPRDRTSRGFPGQRPSGVCFCSLRNHTSVVLYLSTKTTEKQLLILEFHTPSSPWRRHDVTPTEPRCHVDLSNNTHDVIEIPRWHWRNRGNPYSTTYVVSDIFIPPRRPRLDRQTPRVKYGSFFTKYIALVIVHARG